MKLHALTPFNDDLYQAPPAFRKLRFATTTVEARALYEVAEQMGEERLVVPISTLQLIDALNTTSYAVQKAKDLALSRFAGAIEVSVEFTRTRRTLEWVQQLARHLGDEEIFPDADAGKKNARDGVLFMRRLSRAASFRICKYVFKRAGLTPPYKQVGFYAARQQLTTTVRADACVYVQYAHMRAVHSQVKILTRPTSLSLSRTGVLDHRLRPRVPARGSPQLRLHHLPCQCDRKFRRVA